MTLTDLAITATKAFETDRDIAKRMELAEQIAKDYQFEFPQLVLFYTHPNIAKLPVQKRCETMGITTEAYLLYSKQEGFRRFLKDYHDMLQNAMRSQAMINVGEALPDPRFRVTKDGDQIPDYTLEVEVLKAMTQDKNGVTVNVQNNMWGEMRKLTGGVG